MFFFSSKPQFVSCEPYCINNGEKLVENGTYLPIKKQLEDMKRAGVDLEAHRRAYSDYVAGERVDLSEPYEDYRNLDEFDLDSKKTFFLRQIQFEAEKAEELEKRYRFEYEEWKKKKDNPSKDDRSSDEKSDS